MYKCPCGDQPVSISPARQGESYLQGAYWCSTVMALLDFDGTTKYVWNPYSLADLKKKLGNFDDYLDCVASKNDNTCVAPTDQVFEKQQIPMLSVYQRCLSNYQALTWDQGSFVMFNKTLQTNLRLDGVMPGQIDDSFGVAACLLEQKAQGNDNVGCLRDYFLKGSQAVDYFQYSNITSTPNPGSEMIDACLTFSGPSKSPDPYTSQVFLACLEQNANRTGCDIPHMLWSGRSTNKVPVATQHTLDISDQEMRKYLAQGEINAAQDQVLQILDDLSKKWDGSGLKVTLFSSEGDLLHQYADCVMQGPMDRTVLTPGPDNLEKVIWSRHSKGLSDRTFEIPCTGESLANRNGIRDDTPPFTCGTYARRSVLKYFLRKAYGAGMKDNQGAKDAVVEAVKKLINSTRQAWSFSNNFMCTCRNGSTTGWDCCLEQKDCSTEPCPCPQGFEVAASVACCDAVCPGLAGSGVMEPFSYINGSKLAMDLLSNLGIFLKNNIWTSNAPWLEFDPLGAETYEASWNQSQFDVADAGLFDASKPVVYYDEIMYPFQSTFWDHCTGLLQQVIWTMPLDRKNDRPKGMNAPFDPINGRSSTPNMTYTEEFIQSLTLEAYKSSPIYWHYNVRHAPSSSEVCKRSTPRPLKTDASFSINTKNQAAQLGFSSLTLGGLGGADCYCGWWNTATTCKIPSSLCTALIQFVGFTRVCATQNGVYDATDHKTVLSAIQTLMSQQPSTTYPCPSLQISEHWGFMDPSTGMPWPNVTDVILNEGASGFRLGNADWLFTSQATIINPSSRTEAAETPELDVSLQCTIPSNPQLADLFIDDLFPSAQGVRQSMPQSYCTRYGIELARLTVYTAAGLVDAVGQQKSVADKWRMRCQYKLEELAICNSFRVFNATGGPTNTEKCPFTLSIIESLKSSYAVTPGCLVVLWNTPSAKQDGIYDPCICVSCASTPNIDVPSQLTTLCRMEAFQTLVAKDVVPGESPSGVPLGSGSFRSLLDKPGFLQINTPDITHWALHTSVRDADLISDWWPDEWRYPAGYHVTPGCSRPGDAHWRTFDASWRWDSDTEEMKLAKDESNDPFLSRNAFGASGVCRTSNYGMPMKGLNSMAVCTRENANGVADPMVPKKAADDPAWVDGSENCAPDAFATPWKVDRTLNPPRQWSVGTLQREGGLTALSATEWGPGCGPYPLKTCLVDSECADNLKCIFTSGAGVCGSVQASKFECTNHAQCNDDMLCAGDGICVQGVWQIKNELTFPISFRTYSQNCPTGTRLDTWGTSIAETVPDILNASGLCSYRSWFENRRMASRNSCDQSNVCPAFDGMRPWNFSSPKLKLFAGDSAFDNGVLRVRPHPCDKDYQYLEGFGSCTPNDNFLQLFDGNGNPVNQNGSSIIPKDKRTMTYRTNKQIPLIRHADEMTGPTYGFTGVPLTYSELNLGTNSPSIIPCAALRVCGLQPANSFKVNNMPVDRRLVMDVDTTRGYTVQDLLSCGVFGMLRSPGRTTCALDFAIVPLAKFVIDNGLFRSVSGDPYIREGYLMEEKAAVLDKLSKIPDMILTSFIGGYPTNLQEYLARSHKFIDIYSAIKQIKKPRYEGAGDPNQLYYLTLFGAYEVPYAWWFKCRWLGQQAMGVSAVDQCSWSPTGRANQPTEFGSIDKRLALLFGLEAPATQAARTVPLAQALIRLPGIVTQRIFDQAYTDFQIQRNQTIQRTKKLLQSIYRMCFQQKEYVTSFSTQSEAYQLGRVSQFNSAGVFDLTANYTNDKTGAPLCSGDNCLNSIEYSVPTDSNADFTGLVIEQMISSSVTNATIPIYSTDTTEVVDKISLNQPFATNSISAVFWSTLLLKFPNNPAGCSGIVTKSTSAVQKSCLCATRWTDCGDRVLDFMLSTAGVPIQLPDKPLPKSNAILKLSGPAATTELKICDQLDVAEQGTCFLDESTLPANLQFNAISSATVPIGVTIETYVQTSWPCVQLTCGSSNAADNNKMVPTTYQSWSSTTNERIEIDAYEFDQFTASARLNPWTDTDMQQRELMCSEFTFGRFEEKLIKEDHGFSIWTVHTCYDKCQTPSRVVQKGLTIRMKTMNISYFVNSTLVAQIEYYPCIVSEISNDLLNAMSLWTQYAFKNEPQPLSAFQRCKTVFDSATGIPNVAYLGQTYVRNSRSTIISPGKSTGDITASIQRVISSVVKNAGADCMRATDNCPFITGQTTGSFTRFAWKEQDRHDLYCDSLKLDPLFGCAMYPGEQTEPRNTRDSDFGISICSDSWSSINYNVFMLPRCKINDPSDTCKSGFSDISNTPFRDMKLTGNTLAFTLNTVDPACTLGRKRECLLADELYKLNTKNDTVCFGPDHRGLRFREYNKINSFESSRLNTGISDPLVYSGENALQSDASDLFFQHLYIGLNPGYKCCNNCGAKPPTCPRGATEQVAVEVRKNLWKCLNCPMVSNVQCKGSHNCKLTSPLIQTDLLSSMDGWTSLTADQRKFLTQSDSTADVAIPAVQWLLNQISKLWVSDVRLSYEVPDFMAQLSASSSSYTYNPLGVLKYDAAMQINSQSCKLEGSIPDFTNCSHDAHRRDLRDFVQKYYKVNDGAIIGPQETLQWRVKRTQLIAQNIPQWETAINRSGLFVSDLLNDKWCTKGSMTDNACYRHTGADGTLQIDVLNPSLLGAFEPSVGCDTAIVNQQRVVSAGCGDCEHSDPSEYQIMEKDERMPCEPTLDAVRRVTIDDTSPTNLCNKAPEAASSCTNQRGMLSQTKYDGSPMTDLYSTQKWNGVLPAGVTSNSLFWNKPPLTGPSNLVIRTNDIGGHFIRMVVATQTKSGAYSMSIQGLPLSSYSDPLDSTAYALGVSGADKRWTQLNTVAESDKTRTLYPASVCAAWDCPLRRRAFYMGTDPAFRPQVPDPLRTSILYGTRAHPTQAAFPMPSAIAQTASSVLGAYATSNGFCACVSPPCSAKCPPDTAALTGGWVSSSVWSDSVCKEQLDWPYAGGKLRDNSEINQRWSMLTACGILDRLPVFKYRYKNLQSTQSSTKTTLDKGGVCHMGWPVVTAGPLAGCYLLTDTDTYMCPTFLQPKRVPRLRAKTIPELLTSSTRPRLSDCSPPPSYRLANGSATAPEVSYGRLKRWEASRMLANDLRRRLCGNSTVCKPASQWALPTFWNAVYMANFPPIPQGNGENSDRWSKPWVSCTQDKNKTQSCQGTIARKDWATGDRPKICMDVITSQSNSDQLTQSINICDMDEGLDKFCRTIQDARYRVFEANCLYSGQCRQKLFFYQPSTYEVDNNEFVRSTVQTFYNSTVTGACVPDQDTAAQIEINQQNLEKCSAMKLNVLANCIQTVRTIVGLLVEIMFYMGQIMLYVFQMLTSPGAEEKEQISSQINAVLKLLQAKFILLFQEIGDLFYSMLFEGPMGEWLLGMIQKVCNFLEWLFSKVVYVVLCFVRWVAVEFLDKVARGFLDTLNKIPGLSLGYLLDGIDSAISTVKTTIPCTEKKLWDCNIGPVKKNATSTTLPLPTRCWAGAEPGVGSLACSAADTCMQQGDYSKVVCGACPVASSMTRFGCDSLTKLCTCNIFPVGISACTSHEECMIQDDTVNCRYVDSYLQPSYGNVPCSQCPKPMCLIIDGSGVGKCSCLLRPIPSQPCSGIGQRVSPDATKLCLVASSSSGQLSSSNAYTATYRTLFSAPCMLLNQGQTFCYNVYTSATVYTELVVGMSILSTGRRRLLWDEMASNGSIRLLSNTSEWETQSEPCRSLVLANLSQLGVLEQYTRGECWRWYDIGSRLIIEANMTHAVSPFLLVSWKDLLFTMLNRGALIEIMAKMPQVIHRLLLHSEFAQPMYLFVAYWTSMVPEEIWTNQTFLDKATEFFQNTTTQPEYPRRRLLSMQPIPEDIPHLQPQRKRSRELLGVIDASVSQETAYEWSQGPYAWPPNYVYWKQDQSCAVVSTILDVVKHGLDPTIRYYKEPTPEPTPIAWPQLPIKLNASAVTVPAIDITDLKSFTQSTKHALSNLTGAWLDEEEIRHFIRETPYVSVLKGIIQCNFTRIQTCSDRHPLFWSALQTCAIVAVLTVVIRTIQIPYVETLLIIGAVPIFLFITYGYSPTCVPIVPTCLFKDLVDILKWLLPESITWPAGLVTQPDCASAGCMRSCVDDPLVGFTDYNEHLGWFMCEADPAWAIRSAIEMPTDSPIRMAILRKCVDESMRTAQRICFGITLINSFPVLILILVALWLLPSVLALAVALLQFALSTAFSFVLYVHARED